MGEFSEEDHARDEAGKFAEGGGGAHQKAAAGASRSGDHAKAADAHRGAQEAHQQAAQLHPGDHAAQAQHMAQAANHAGQAAKHDEHSGGLPAFVDKHAPAEGHGEAKGGHEKEGLGKWLAGKLGEAKEHVEEKAEAAHELEEKLIEGDPFKAGEALAGAAGGAVAGVGKDIAGKLGGGKEHGGH